MKYILLSITLFGCCKYSNKKTKFMMGQNVSYKVYNFYRLVCSGKGKILDYIRLSDDFYYSVEPIMEDRVQGCPGTIKGLKESEISL